MSVSPGDERNLDELGDKAEAIGATGCTSLSVYIGTTEERQREDDTVLIHCTVRCLCVSGTSHLAVDISKLGPDSLGESFFQVRGTSGLLRRPHTELGTGKDSIDSHVADDPQRERNFV